MDADVPSLILIAVLLLLSAFFSASETSLFSLDNIRLRKMRRYRGIKRIKQLLGESSTLLIAILLGNTAVNVAVAAKIEGILHIENYVLSTIIVTAILLFFGEVTPKTVAIIHREEIASFNSRFLYPIFIVLRPIARPIKSLSNLILKCLNKLIPAKDNGEEDRLAALLSMVSRESFLDRGEKKLVESVLRFTNKEVTSILTPRTKLISLKQSTPLKRAIEVIKETKFSKIPIFSKTDDNIIGVIFLTDLLPYIHNPQTIGKKTVKDIMRNMYFVPETKRLSEMLEDFQQKHIRIATVVDEYGSALGIVTVADVLGEIVGEIMDESFNIHRKILPLSKKRFLVHGDIDLEDFNQFFKTKLYSTEFESLAGYVIEKAGDIPEAGYSLEVEKYTLTVRDRTTNHIEKFLVEVR